MELCATKQSTVEIRIPAWQDSKRDWILVQITRISRVTVNANKFGRGTNPCVSGLKSS